MIYVYDNNSKDRTVECARAAGAVVRRETRQGKGHVVRRMFADVEADIYVLADGDGTYDAASAPAMVEKLIDEQLDMVVGSRLTTYEGEAFRRGHRFGNDLLTGFLGLCFGRTFTDILSGYRVFSRRFVKSFPALSAGFETETELSVHALELRMPIAEVVTPYKARPAGSASKLRTYRDGFRILMMILNLFKEERPLAFFSIIAGVLALDRRRPGLPRLRHLPRNRPGAALPHGDPVHRPHDPGQPEPHLRLRAGHRHPRPPRDEAPGLPVHSPDRKLRPAPAGRRNPAESPVLFDSLGRIHRLHPTN